jgi:hypothetical protein
VLVRGPSSLEVVAIRAIEDHGGAPVDLVHG